MSTEAVLPFKVRVVDDYSRPLTDTDIERDLKICEAATIGPWSTCGADDRGEATCSCRLIWAGDHENTVVSGSREGESMREQGDCATPADLILIARARAGWPAALTALKTERVAHQELQEHYSAVMEERDTAVRDKCEAREEWAERRKHADTLAVLAKLVTRLDEVHEDPAFKGIWVLAAVHGVTYTGPTYIDELKEARGLLALLKPPVGSDPKI